MKENWNQYTTSKGAREQAGKEDYSLHSPLHKISLKLLFRHRFHFKDNSHTKKKKKTEQGDTKGKRVMGVFVFCFEGINGPLVSPNIF